MEKELLNKIKIEKQKLLLDGFKIIGVFGSYATNTQTKESDIDLLYDIEPIFTQKYAGFEAFSRLSEIKESLQKSLNLNVDIATVDNNSKTFKKFALKDVIYV
ncbi:MAG: nucleotidyltransferase family protein [Candidatus Marinarcus sp.]|uniref:nucleotidyltransferase family protein n=1 Tax=Candidatus Marinarcus sp. TaxID=3100987 RepID=UPI003B0020B9